MSGKKLRIPLDFRNTRSGKMCGNVPLARLYRQTLTILGPDFCFTRGLIILNSSKFLHLYFIQNYKTIGNFASSGRKI